MQVFFLCKSCGILLFYFILLQIVEPLQPNHILDFIRGSALRRYVDGYVFRFPFSLESSWVVHLSQLRLSLETSPACSHAIYCCAAQAIALSSLISSLSLNHHLHAHDTSFSFPSSLAGFCSNTDWMTSNVLDFNSAKTEFLFAKSLCPSCCCSRNLDRSAPVEVQSIAINSSVCASVCLSVREHISGTAEPIRTKFCARIPCGRGSVLLRRRCATLCTSGFMDDVTFDRNGQDASKGWQHLASAINYVRDRGAESDAYEWLFHF